MADPVYSLGGIKLYPGKVTKGLIFIQREGNTTDRMAVIGQASKMLEQIIGGPSEFIGPMGTGGDLANFAVHSKYARPMTLKVSAFNSSEWTSFVQQVYSRLAYKVGDNPILVTFTINWRGGAVTYPLPAFKEGVVVAVDNQFPASGEPDMYPDQYRQLLAERLGAGAAVTQAWVNLGVKFAGGLLIGPLVFAPDMAQYLLSKGGGASNVINTAAQFAGNAAGSTVKTAVQAQQAVAKGIGTGMGAAVQAATGVNPMAPLGINYKQWALIGGVGALALYLYFRKDINEGVARGRSAVKGARKAALESIFKG
jgi:hypothetical protein